MMITAWQRFDRLINNFAELPVMLRGVLKIEANPNSELANGTVEIRAMLNADFALRHPGSFGVLTADE